MELHLFTAFGCYHQIPSRHILCLCSYLDVEVDVDELNQEQVLDVNKMATSYGMAEGDFVR